MARTGANDITVNDVFAFLVEVAALLSLTGLPQFVGIFGVSRVRFAWSGAWSGR